MERRKFIALSATALAGLAIPFACASENYKNIVAAMPKLSPLEKFCTEKELHDIGTKYIATVPEEGDLSTIGKYIFKNDAGQLVDANPAAIEKLLDAKIAMDFQADHTTIVDGWVISITEARVCGVIALT